MSPATRPTPSTDTRSINHRPLNDRQTRNVHAQLAEQNVACQHCQSHYLQVGDALEMGSIWPNEDLGTYMIALTCQHCSARNGIRFHESQFSTADM